MNSKHTWRNIKRRCHLEIPRFFSICVSFVSTGLFILDPVVVMMHSCYWTRGSSLTSVCRCPLSWNLMTGRRAWSQRPPSVYSFIISSSGRAVFLAIFPQHRGVSHLFWSRLLSLGKVQGSREKRGLETQNHFQVVGVCNKWQNMFAATVPFPSGKCLSHSNPAQQNKTPNAFSSPVRGKYTAWF